MQKKAFANGIPCSYPARSYLPASLVPKWRPPLAAGLRVILPRARQSLDGLLPDRHHQQVPPSPSAVAPARWLTPLLLAAPSLIFVLPYFVPVAPAFSESFLFGFNNRVALGLLLALIALLALLSWRGLVHCPSLSQTPSPAVSPASGNTPGLVSLAVTLAIAAILSAVLFALLRAGNGTGDAIYFLDRIGLLAQGLHPFRDFEFVYGPLQLYAPWLTARLLHLSLTDAYGLIWGLSTLLGITALWYAIRWLDLPSQGKSATFLILATILGSELLSFGLNYNPLRYTLPIACLLFVDRLDRSGSSSLVTSRSTLLAAITSAILLIGLSPEIGVTFCIAILCFLPARRRTLH